MASGFTNKLSKTISIKLFKNLRCMFSVQKYDFKPDYLARKVKTQKDSSENRVNFAICI
jgi:hypothetical protein